MFNKIYGFMKFVGLAITLFAVGLFIWYGKYDNTGYSIMLFVAILLQLTTGIVDILSKLGRIKIFNQETGAVITGHISVMLGVIALISTAMNNNGIDIGTALAVIAILVVFMMIMLFVLLRIFKTMMDLVNNTEPKDNNDESEKK